MSMTAKSMARENPQFFKDVVSLTKPRITVMAILVASAGVLHASDAARLSIWPALFSLLGIAFLVSGSSALNMYFERELDAKMTRTKDRALPAGRLDAGWALFTGVALAIGASVLLYFESNLLTLWAGLFAFILYVFLYTPLKQKSWLALLVGSIPGAMPVMLGYISLSGELDKKALALFFWAFLWQVPHFLAISLFREKEYTQAGFPVMSAQYGVLFTKRVIIFSSWLLALSTIPLYLSDIIGLVGLVLSFFLGAWFLFRCHKGVYRQDTNLWARGAFKASLIYQSLLFVLLIIEAII